MPTPLPTTIPVDYAEMEDGLSGGVDDRGDYEARTYVVAWDDKQSFIQAMKGTAKISGGSAGRWVTTTPYQSPDNPRLYVADIKWVPAGTPIIPSNPTRYSHVKVTVTFRPPTYDFGPADPVQSLSQDPVENNLLTYCSQEIDYSREWFTVAHSRRKFLNTGKAVEDPQSVSISVQLMRLTYHRFPVLPVGYLRQYQDCVNDAVFLGCPRGTVMLDMAQCRREFVVGGEPAQQLTMVYKYRAVDWNMAMIADSPTFDYVVNSAYSGPASGSAFNNAVNYKYKDFRALLWVDFLGSSGS